MLRPFAFVLALASLATLGASCAMDQAPEGLRRTPAGPGATVRFDLAHKPLPEIPLPNDTATWPDPTSRTGLRVNASLVAPTAIEQDARLRFSRMEGWGVFAPISVAFDVDHADPVYADYSGPALDLANIKRRHRGDDYDFADDTVYLVNLTTGVPVPIDFGAGNFQYTLKELGRYWPNDTRATERNLLFETIDETRGGAVTKQSFRPADDTDFDGNLDVPDLDDPAACPQPDPTCDDAGNAQYGSAACLAKRRGRDQCVADHLTVFYERESDTLLLRPLIPLDEMTRYAVVITDRLIDGKGHPVKSPFNFVYHASMEPMAARVLEVMNDPKHRSYFGDIAGTGLDHVAFTWGYTTQPTVDDMKRLRDGLYGHGPFASWSTQYPPRFELARSAGLTAGLRTGVNQDEPGWATSDAGKKFGCDKRLPNLYTVKYADIRSQIKTLLTQGFGVNEGPAAELLMQQFENIDHMVIGAYESPFMLEGGPQEKSPKATFNLNFLTGEGEQSSDTVQFWMVVPKETAEFKQPFNVNIYGHGYTSSFVEELFYAGNMASHGLATVGINAVGHGGDITDPTTLTLAGAVLRGACMAPFLDGITWSRARDLNNDGAPDSGGDFWSSYIFHTRDSVRQSVLDHVQLVRVMRAFGTSEGQMLCRNDKTGWASPAKDACDLTGDGKPELAGDFDGDGRVDAGGPSATYGTWGESLGGILSGIHGAVDPYVSAAVPGSGGGGLTDVGIRSFQGGVIEAVLLRVWGPLLVTLPSGERPQCTPTSTEGNDCTICAADQYSLRWVMPDLNGTGELEVACLTGDQLLDTTVIVNNTSNGETKCASVGANGRLRIGLPSAVGDQVRIDLFSGANQVTDYASCAPNGTQGATPKLTITQYGPGRVAEGGTNDVADPNAVISHETCSAPSCGLFQNHFFAQGAPLTAPAEGYGLIRQTASLRRFMQLAQMALEPGDPISFAPYYALKPMTDPEGNIRPPHAVLTANTIGDMNVPLNAGMAFARASGALPFLRPEAADKYPEYADYTTPAALYQQLGGKTPNQVLIDKHVVEGISALARHPAGADCATSANVKAISATFTEADGTIKACFPKGCTAATEMDSATRVCWDGSFCDVTAKQCRPSPLGQQTCDEALFDADDLDEGASRYFEQNAPSPLRLARYARSARASGAGSAGVSAAWGPRLQGQPFTADGGWKPDETQPLLGLMDAYIVPQGVHTWVNGDPCQSWDSGTYLTHLTARFFMTRGTDLYYLSHPGSHQCLGIDVKSCDYMNHP